MPQPPTACATDDTYVPATFEPADNFCAPLYDHQEWAPAPPTGLGSDDTYVPATFEPADNFCVPLYDHQEFSPPLTIVADSEIWPPLQWADQIEVAAPLYDFGEWAPAPPTGLGADDTWTPPSAVSPTRIIGLDPWVFDGGEISFVVPPIAADDDGWQPIAMPAITPGLWQPWAYAGDELTAIIADDDTGVVLFAPPSAVALQPFFDDGARPTPPAIAAAEDGWWAPRAVLHAPIVFVWLDAGEDIATGIPYVRPATEPTVAICTDVTSIAVCNDVTSIVITTAVTSLAILLDADGAPMATNSWEFTQGETGPLTAVIEGSDGTPENLATATSVKFNLRAVNGRIVVKRGATSGLTSGGQFTYTRQAADVAKPGNYIAQLEVVRADGTKAEMPTGGIAVTILPAVIDPAS